MVFIQTPGCGNVVWVDTTAPVQLPMYAIVAASEMVSSEEAYATDGVQISREWWKSLLGNLWLDAKKYRWI